MYFKDGTGGSRDYRAVSTLYLLFRMAVAGIFFLNNQSLIRLYIIGFCHIFMGTLILIVKPYKKNWMNYVDGVIVDLAGFVPLLVPGFFDIIQITL